MKQRKCSVCTASHGDPNEGDSPKGNKKGLDLLVALTLLLRILKEIILIIFSLK